LSLPTSLRDSALLACALALAACSTTRVIMCRTTEDLVVADTLYFGTNKPGGVVSAEEWQVFLAGGVTPRFPQGITSWRATGQWRSDSGALEHEASYVLQLVHADNADTERGVREVMALYRDRFEQEAVLRVRLPACISLK
jgi:hypothetical protein